MKSGKAVIIFIFFTFFVISLLIEGTKKEETKTEEKKEISETAVCTDGFQELNEAGDRLHQRDWENNKLKTFCASYESNAGLSFSLGQARNRMTVEALDYKDLWGTVYKNLVADSKSSIQFLVDSLSNLGKEKGLKRMELAEMVVAFVQDIPYSYILNIPCSSYDTKGKPCVGNIALGILTPYEFLHSLHGDCDTRSVLIYAVLEEMGYDPMIVVSNQYAHAMLALNIQTSGDHIKHGGKNYYFWETTAKGWPIGLLPPSTGNVNYWKVALVGN